MSARVRIATPAVAVTVASSCVDPPALPEVRVTLSGTAAIGDSSNAAVTLTLCFIPTGTVGTDAATDAGGPDDVGSSDVVATGSASIPDDCRAPWIRRLASCGPCLERMRLHLQAPQGRYASIRVTAYRPHACRNGVVVQIPTAVGSLQGTDFSLALGSAPTDVSISLQPTQITPSCP